MEHFDDDINRVLETTHRLGSKMTSPYSADQLRMAIVAMNLRALVNTLLTADADPNVKVDFKQVALGILGTVDFLEAELPSLDSATESGDEAPHA